MLGCEGEHQGMETTWSLRAGHWGGVRDTGLECKLRGVKGSRPRRPSGFLSGPHASAHAPGVNLPLLVLLILALSVASEGASAKLTLLMVSLAIMSSWGRGDVSSAVM